MAVIVSAARAVGVVQPLPDRKHLRLSPAPVEPVARQFQQDEAAALRAAEIEADVVIKGTHSGVDGVYSADPRSDASATKYDEVGYLEVMTKNLKVMDATAIAFCRDNGIPIVVFDMSKPGSLRSIVQGGREGTLVHEV